ANALAAPGGGGGGGGTYGAAALAQLFFGSGGGGGGDAGYWAGSGESGGDGGGIVFIIANAVDNNATIQTQGAGGITATDGDGASGGGAGGSLLIQANSVDNTGGTITAAGGAGGDRDSNPDAGGGGGGGVGRVRIEADSIINPPSLASTAGTPSGIPTKTFNSVGSTYWYHDVAWPTGNDNATIAAGNYTFNMYFNSLPTGSNWYNTNWSYRKQITVQSSQVDANVSNFPVYVDLADLGADFFSNVNADGGDIRVTNSTGTVEMPREVVAINTGAQTGELHFRADSLSSSANTNFYIYYGNSGASDYAVTATYGRNNVWSNSYAAVWHLEEEAAGTSTTNLYVDSTGNGNAGDDRVSATWQLGRLGSGQELDGSDDFIDMGDVLDFADPASFSLESWIRPAIPPSAGPLQVSGTSSFTNYDAVPSVTFQHTTPSGNNRLLMVAVSFDNDNLETVTSVTYNGDPLTFINSVQRNDDARVELWARVAPDVGTNLNVVVTFSTDPNPILQGGTVGATSFTGAEQVIPNAADFVGAAATSAGPATVDVTSATGELVFAAVGCETCDGLTPVAMTEQWNDVNPITPAYYGAAATKAGATTTTMRWDIVKVAGDHWAIGAIPIRPDAGGLTDQMSFITKWSGTGRDRNYRFEVETDNTLTFLPGGGVNPNLNSTTVFTTDTWYHAAVSVSQSTDTIRLYVNGSQEDVNTAWTGVIGNGISSFNLGRRADVSQWFDGNLDEVRVSSTDRVTGWTSTGYNNQNSTSTFYNVASQEAYQSVDITIHVHHTATDGTGATLITSASTTIDATTADPLAFDVGNDAIGQTFTSADPRVLRVQVEVTAVNNGGSFVLDYDGPCASNQCSSLDTPVVVVPEFGLIFGAFALLVPVAMGGIWRRRRKRMSSPAARARATHDPLAHSQKLSKRGLKEYPGAVNQ
ncbi:MAG: LamG-like jellyroll fold domain-containing protein, partial [Anaerolineales bacterium]